MRSPFGSVNPRHRKGIRRIGRETIDGLRGQANETTGSKSGNRRRYAVYVRSDELRHHVIHLTYR